MKLTRREFLKKSAIIAGGVAVAATVPSVLTAGVKKESPEQIASGRAGYAQVVEATDLDSYAITNSSGPWMKGDKLTIGGIVSKPAGLQVFTVTEAP